MKRFILACVLSGIGASAWSQTPLNCESDVASLDAVETLICSDPSLRSSHRAMAQIWQVWQSGINQDRIAYLEDEQASWMSARNECLAEAAPTDCLKARYQERVSVLSGARIYQSEVNLIGKSFNSFEAMSPLRYDALFIDTNLNASSAQAQIVEAYQPRLTAPLEEDCGLCTHERQSRFESAFVGPTLEFATLEEVEQYDSGDEVTRHQTLIFDRNTGQQIGFLDLFEPSTVPFAKANLIEAITAELDRLNKELPNNADGQTQYYWKEIGMNLEELSADEWNRMGFYPRVEGGQIAGFDYASDDYEFAPYGSSAYFSGFYIDAVSLVPFIKPQYQANFK